VVATNLRAQGREAIRHAALAYGLPTDMTILSERWNTVARLGESGVIAKAAPIGRLARRDSARWYQQEIDSCRFLMAKGAPVQTPHADSVIVDEASGIPVSLWQVVPGEVGGASEERLVDSLAELHRLGEEIVLNQPWFATITSHFPDAFAAFRDRGLVDGATIQAMDDQCSRLMERLATFDLEHGFVHGDAQRKNTIAHGNRVIWIDFEECSIGPLAWDLACLAKHAAFSTDRILDRYAVVSGSNRIPNEAIEVLQQLRDLEALTWMIAIQEAREPEFRRATADWLDRWRVTAG
jgi:Ser/Thr protein kinase RdoA (MazF antagonist)